MMNIISYKSDTRTYRCWRGSLVVLTVLAIGLRVGTMLWLNTPGVYGGDEGGYVALAKQWLSTGRYSIPEVNWAPIQGGVPGDPTAFRTPGLPLFLACHYWLFGKDDIFPKVTLVILSGLTCTMIASLGGKLFSHRCGLLAGAIWAFWPTALVSGYRADSIVTENLGLFFFVASLLCLSVKNRHGSSQKSAVVGLLIGAAILTRPFLLLAVPPLLLWLLSRPGPNGLRFKPASFMIIGLSLLLGPWLARNWMVFGRPILSTQAEHLYMGNNAWARGSMNGDIWSLGVNAPQFKVLEKTHPRIWETSETERAEIWKEEGLRCVGDNLCHPKYFLWLEVRKALVFWLPLQDWSFGLYKYHYLLIIITLFVPIGLLLGYRRGLGSSLSLLLIPILSVFLVCLGFYSHDRIRYMQEPFLVLIGAYGMIETFRALLRQAPEVGAVSGDLASSDLRGGTLASTSPAPTPSDTSAETR